MCHLAEFHRGHRLARIVVQLVPGRHTGVDVEVSRRRAITRMNLRRVLFCESQRPIALQPEALHLGAGIEPGIRRCAVALEHAGRRVVGWGIGIHVDIVFMQRPDIAAIVGRAAEGLHALLAAELRVRRNVVRQLHVVAVALPAVVDNRHVVDAVVLQRPQILGIALERAVVVAPDIEHDPRAEQFAMGRWRMRDVGQHLDEIGRDGQVTRFIELDSTAVGLRFVYGLALRTLRGARIGPVETTANEHVLLTKKLDMTGEIGHVEHLVQRCISDSAERKPRDHRAIAFRGNQQRLAADAVAPGDRHNVALDAVFPIDIKFVSPTPRRPEPAAVQPKFVSVAWSPRVSSQTASRRRLKRPPVVDLDGNIIERARGRRESIR